MPIKTTTRKSTGKKKVKKVNYKAKLDKIFSLYIRLRDTDENGYFKCPTCGKIKPFDQADCSHYWSRTHNSTRFDEENCVAECSYDNRFNSSHLDGLREHLIAKLGQEAFDRLRERHLKTKRYSDKEYQELINIYQAKVIQLKRSKTFIVS